MRSQPRAWAGRDLLPAAYQTGRQPTRAVPGYTQEDPEQLEGEPTGDCKRSQRVLGSWTP